MFKLLLWKEILSHRLFMSKKMDYPCGYHMIFLSMVYHGSLSSASDWAATFGTAMTVCFPVDVWESFKISQPRLGSTPAAPDSVQNGVDVVVPRRRGLIVVRVAKLK
ncbi:hypothetical protein C4D60_Mb06t27660 [Musa balbisiana]|uniref:Uncharacterized protein n=1 Tax=Musa balbisiana TaxID=52838 RepID=A0A4S8IR38_MUSBA|nr:hypothetical protein C4D60_Mb06t27660 [Musa balbisiana]